MKKILLIVFISFCIFFINLNVNAEVVYEWIDNEDVKLAIFYNNGKWDYRIDDVYDVDIAFSLEYNLGISNKSGLNFSDALLVELNKGNTPGAVCINGNTIDLDVVNPTARFYNPVGTSGYVEKPVENQKVEENVDENGNITIKCVYYGVDIDDVLTIEYSNGKFSFTSQLLNVSDYYVIPALEDKLLKEHVCPGIIYSDGSILNTVNPGAYMEYSANRIDHDNYVTHSKDDDIETEELWKGKAGTQTCDALDNVNEILQEKILKPMRYVVPIIFLIMTSFDFAKSVFSDEKSGIGKAKKNLIIRIVVSILVFFVPNIVQMLFDLFKLTC